MVKPIKTGDQRRMPTKSKIDRLKKRIDDKNQEKFFLVKKKSKNNKLKRNKEKSSDSCKTLVCKSHKWEKKIKGIDEKTAVFSSKFLLIKK